MSLSATVIDSVNIENVSVTTASEPLSIQQRTAAVAAVAAQYADVVDREGRFPAEAVAAMRQYQLFAMAVPEEFGGEGASLDDVAYACKALGSACSSAAMVFAMHQSQLYCLTRHAQLDSWHATFLASAVANQWLIASATSEESIGGDLRSSLCAVAPDAEGRFVLSKKTPTISYGAYADVILVTARRTATCNSADQVLVTVMREALDLTPTTPWDTMGMRGTCSGGFMLEARGHQHQILETPFAEIAARTMVPVSHILWSHAWMGIAAAAVRRGQAFFRKKARVGGDTVTQSGMRLANAVGMLRGMESTIQSVMRSYGEVCNAQPGTLMFGSAVQMNDLKVRVSTTALQIVGEIMQLCGMAAYKNDSPYSVGRHLRDLHSAPIMINNDRLMASSAVLMMAERAV